eukprot:gene7785-976_t
MHCYALPSPDFRALGVYKGPPILELSTPKQSNAGRNSHGRITARGRGGGEKKTIRTVDYARDGLDGVSGTVLRLEHDPNRTGFLALTRYDAVGKLPELRYHIAPANIKAGDVLPIGSGSPLSPGSTLALRDIPIGVPIHNLELKPGKGGQLARAASTCASIQVKQEDNAIVKLPSGELRYIPLDCTATIGLVSNHLNKLTNLGKAGASRKLGRRPIDIVSRKGGQPIDKFANAKKVAMHAWKNKKPDGKAPQDGKTQKKAQKKA